MIKLGSGAERLIDAFVLTREHVPNNESEFPIHFDPFYAFMLL